MTETFYQWIGSLACYYLVYSIVMNVIPKKEYQVYVKSFMGMLLVIILLTPVMKVMRSDYDLSEIFHLEEMKRAWMGIQGQEEAGLAMEKDTYFLYACQEEIAGQIRSLAQEKGFQVVRVQVELEQGEQIQIKEIEAVLEREDEDSRAKEELIEELAQVYEISEGDVHVYLSNS
ncbi:MAG: stage III sporulation protein AF [Ruminococcus sp.]|jgi:stage III sporulation protein AF